MSTTCGGIDSTRRRSTCTAMSPARSTQSSASTGTCGAIWVVRSCGYKPAVSCPRSTTPSSRLTAPSCARRRGWWTQRASTGPARVITCRTASTTTLFHASVPWDERDPVVAALYHDHPLKGTIVALAAMQEVHEHLPDTRFVMFGNVVAKPPLPEWIEYHHDPEQERIVELYNEASVWLQTSIVEGFGLTAVEAMACGAVLVSTDCGGSRDYASSETAFVSASHQPRDVAAALVDALEHPDRASQRSSNGRAFVRRFDWHRSAAILERALSRVMHGACEVERNRFRLQSFLPERVSRPSEVSVKSPGTVKPKRIEPAFADRDRVWEIVTSQSPYRLMPGFVSHQGHAVPWFLWTWPVPVPYEVPGLVEHVICNDRFVDAAAMLFDAAVVHPVAVTVNFNLPSPLAWVHTDPCMFRQEIGFELAALSTPMANSGSLHAVARTERQGAELVLRRPRRSLRVLARRSRRTVPPRAGPLRERGDPRGPRLHAPPRPAGRTSGALPSRRDGDIGQHAHTRAGWVVDRRGR